MEKQVYITEKERIKYQKVTDVFAKLYDMTDMWWLMQADMDL